MEKIIMEKKGDTFTQIVTIYYINISQPYYKIYKRKENTK